MLSDHTLPEVIVSPDGNTQREVSFPEYFAIWRRHGWRLVGPNARAREFASEFGNLLNIDTKLRVRDSAGNLQETTVQRFKFGVDGEHPGGALKDRGYTVDSSEVLPETTPIFDGLESSEKYGVDPVSDRGRKSVDVLSKYKTLRVALLELTTKREQVGAELEAAVARHETACSLAALEGRDRTDEPANLVALRERHERLVKDERFGLQAIQQFAAEQANTIKAELRAECARHQQEIEERKRVAFEAVAGQLKELCKDLGAGGVVDAVKALCLLNDVANPLQAQVHGLTAGLELNDTSAVAALKFLAGTPEIVRPG
jgi:hypothetical protein